MKRDLIKIVACFILLIHLSENYSMAQTVKPVTQDSTIIHQKDIVDVLQDNFKIHLRADSTKQKGSGPYFSLMPVVGYSLQSGLTGA